jgi:hypothetical protein
LGTVEGGNFACFGESISPKIRPAVEDADIVKVAGELACGAFVLAYAIVGETIIEGIPATSVVDSVGIS